MIYIKNFMRNIALQIRNIRNKLYYIKSCKSSKLVFVHYTYNKV